MMIPTLEDFSKEILNRRFDWSYELNKLGNPLPNKKSIATHKRSIVTRLNHHFNRYCSNWIIVEHNKNHELFNGVYDEEDSINGALSFNNKTRIDCFRLNTTVGFDTKEEAKGRTFRYLTCEEFVTKVYNKLIESGQTLYTLRQIFSDPYQITMTAMFDLIPNTHFIRCETVANINLTIPFDIRKSTDDTEGRVLTSV